MANFQQGPLGAARAETLAAITAAIAEGRRGARRDEPPADEGLRPLMAFRQIAETAQRRRLIEHADGLARAVKGKIG